MHCLKRVQDIIPRKQKEKQKFTFGANYHLDLLESGRHLVDISRCEFEASLDRGQGWLMSITGYQEEFWQALQWPRQQQAILMDMLYWLFWGLESSGCSLQGLERNCFGFNKIRKKSGFYPVLEVGHKILKYKTRILY